MDQNKMRPPKIQKKNSEKGQKNLEKKFEEG